MLEVVTMENVNELLNLTKEELETKIFNVETKAIYDADINPREIDEEYAEKIPLSAPPVILGLLEDQEDDFFGRLFIIDGNHRMHSWKNIHNAKHCLANIRKYPTMDEAVIDAFRLNVNHGRRLTDVEIYSSIKRIAISLKRKNKEKPMSELCKLLNMSKTSYLEYVHWGAIEKILNENNNGAKIVIEKVKANMLYYILKEKRIEATEEERKEYIRIFYGLTKELPTRKTKELIKYFRETQKICSYEEYLINKSLEQDTAADKANEEIKRQKAEAEAEELAKKIETALDNGPEEITVATPILVKEPMGARKAVEDTPKVMTPTFLNGFEKDEEEEEVHDPEDYVQIQIGQPVLDTNQDIKSEEVINGYMEDSEDEKETEPVSPMITIPNEIIDEGKKIDFVVNKATTEVTQETPKQEEDILVNFKGLTRKLKFQTVMENIFNELQEDTLSSYNLLNEILDKEIHNHREEFEEHKSEYLALLNNSYSTIKKMMIKVSRVNKDFNNED